MITIVKMLEKKLNGCQTITTLLLTFFFLVCVLIVKGTGAASCLDRPPFSELDGTGAVAGVTLVPPPLWPRNDIICSTRSLMQQEEWVWNAAL